MRSGYLSRMRAASACRFSATQGKMHEQGAACHGWRTSLDAASPPNGCSSLNDLIAIGCMKLVQKLQLGSNTGLDLSCIEGLDQARCGQSQTAQAKPIHTYAACRQQI
jgi:hypothetical protein